MSQKALESSRKWLCAQYPTSISSAALAKETPGLKNLGNTSYLNAALQCIMHSPPLASYLYRFIDHRLCESDINNPYCVRCELGLFTKAFFKAPAHSIVPPKRLLNSLCHVNPEITRRKQQNVSDFLPLLFEYISSREFTQVRETDNFIRSTMKAPIAKIVQGLVSSTVTCQICDSVHKSDIPFDTLNVPIDDNQTIQNALAEHFATIPLYNKVHCHNCRKRTTSTQRDYIREAPNVFILSLTREGGSDSSSEDDHQLGSDEQLSEELDLAQYMRHENNTNKHLKYNLKSIIVHGGGSMDEGHYTAYVRNNEGQWYLKDDEDTLMIPISRVLQQKPSVLFYQRVYTDTRPDTEQDRTNIDEKSMESSSIMRRNKNRRADFEQGVPNEERGPAKRRRTNRFNSEGLVASFDIPSDESEEETTYRNGNGEYGEYERQNANQNEISGNEGEYSNQNETNNLLDEVTDSTTLFDTTPIEFEMFKYRLKMEAYPEAAGAIRIPLFISTRHTDRAELLQEYDEEGNPVVPRNEIIRFEDQLPMTTGPWITVDNREGQEYFSNIGRDIPKRKGRRKILTRYEQRKKIEGCIQKASYGHRSLINPKRVYWKPNISGYLANKYEKVLAEPSIDDQKGRHLSPFDSTKLYGMYKL